MADDDLLVTISGPALSLLLYENTRCHDQIGFLLGEILIYVTKKVTDSDRDIEHVKTHINIKTVVAYPIGPPFFNTIGIIDEEKLKSVLKGSTKKVVGWYHYRSDLDLIMTMRDRNLHTSLSSFFSNVSELHSPKNFIVCLLNSSISEEGGTHKFKHLLKQKIGTDFKPVPLKINNLGADSTRPDGTDYKPTPKRSSSNSDAFDVVYEQIKNKLKGTSGVEAVTLIQKAAEAFLEQLIPQVTDSDRQVSELEEELHELRTKFYSDKYANIYMQMKEQCSKLELDMERNSPESPEIFSSQKSNASGDSSESLTIPKKNLRKESGYNEQAQDSIDSSTARSFDSMKILSDSKSSSSSSDTINRRSKQ